MSRRISRTASSFPELKNELRRACCRMRRGSNPARPPACSTCSNGNGEEARVVGGAVRNALLKLPVADIDIATTALPDEVIRRAQAAGIKSVPTGIEHGTVTLVVDEQPFEVTTLREDTETFGRKAKVAFGRDWARDAERRDFTINGLSVDADGVVHDHVGGLADIAARRVRFIGDPGARIAEDYLRILRFFRIHAAYGAGEPDRAGYLACIGGRAGLSALSAERRADGNAQADGRGRRGGGAVGDGGWRAAAARFSAASPIPDRSPR